MYIGKLQQWKQETPYLPSWLEPWIRQLACMDFQNLTTGRHELGGDSYMNVDEAMTERPCDRRLEAHCLYADVQMVLTGQEIIGYQPLCQTAGLQESQPGNDVYFYDSDPAADVLLPMVPGVFAVFLPGDGHRPLCAPTGESGPVRKIIMKIRLGQNE